ncbi:MAG: cell division protein ZipA C-terminal FtsZ-binding domain-containing protein [Rhodocyclaceae bacterium]|nr:cell division protein ZipA C-terminal FtsZ-binding domain-containing protein [Rhodocyclaceae bacterium]MDZ4215168.1 cell division protein ZipA C-terminal FtsZ-binding domain-containing protein [Rhodocyclaceae bacterium]
MSELQMALVGLGLLLVLLVWGYNLWQEKKISRQASDMLPKAAPDVLMAGREASSERSERAEPSVYADEPDEMVEPTFAPSAPSPEVEQESPVSPLPAEWADGAADCLLRIEFVDPVPVASLWAERSTMAAGIDKPMQWLGLDEKNGRWRALLPQDPGSVIQLAIALQLTDRRGPIGETTLSAFLGGAHQLAQRFAGLVELPEIEPLLRRANDLDGFCVDVDLQLSVQVMPRSGSLNDMMGGKLVPLINQAGLREEGERYVSVDADGVERFAMTCANATGAAVTQVETAALASVFFALDVPRVADGAVVFDQMMALANQCAEALGGQVADAHRNPLPAAKLTAIRGRIADVQSQMAVRGMPAGSMRALRLFS